MKTFLKEFTLATDSQEIDYIRTLQRTGFNGVYPFKIFPNKGLTKIKFSPITIFYGNNGSGKSTLLNIISEKIRVEQYSVYNKGIYFDHYLTYCRADYSYIPQGSKILRSDDIFNYLLNVRSVNKIIDDERNNLFDDYFNKKYSSHRLKGLDDYYKWKESQDAKTQSQSEYVRQRLAKNFDMFSNGESAMKIFIEHITEEAIYLIDEPENSMSFSQQLELKRYIEDSARFFNCQFIIATHSPVFLALNYAEIYNLDKYPVPVKKWTELENVRKLYEFFEEHKNEFEEI